MGIQVIPPTGGEGGASGPVEWVDVLNKPATYPAEAHTHDGAYDPLGAAAAEVGGHDADPASHDDIRQLVAGKAASGHNHDGDYAAASHNHDAAYAKKSASHNLTNITGAVAINLNNGDLQYGTVTAAATISFTNAPAAPAVGSVSLEMTNGGAFTITWPNSATLKWDGGTAPTLTAAGTDILEFYTRDGGTTWRGFLASKDSK